MTQFRVNRRHLIQCQVQQNYQLIPCMNHALRCSLCVVHAAKFNAHPHVHNELPQPRVSQFLRETADRDLNKGGVPG